MMIGEVIKQLNKYPKNKQVKILACNNNPVEDYPLAEDISEIGYAMIFDNKHDEKTGKPFFYEDEDVVYIFTENYNDLMLMNGV